MAEDVAATRQQLALLLRRLTVELDAVGQRFAGLHGLNRTDVRALVAIMDAARSGRPMTAGGLGAAVELSSAAVTALVDRLERGGPRDRGGGAARPPRGGVGMLPGGPTAGGGVFWAGAAGPG